MSTPRIPAAAVEAAAVQARTVGLHGRDGVHIHYPTYAEMREILAAALPHLGDTRTEYTVRVTRDGRSHDLDDTATRDRARAERGAERVRGYKTQTAVVARTVTTGPWTEET